MQMKAQAYNKRDGMGIDYLLYLKSRAEKK